MSTDDRYARPIAAKERLIRQAEEMAQDPNLENGHDRAQALLQRWNSSGHPGPAADAMWRKFKRAQDLFYARLREQPKPTPRQASGRSGSARDSGPSTPQIVELESKIAALKLQVDKLRAEMIPIERQLQSTSGPSGGRHRMTRELARKKALHDKKRESLIFFAGQLREAREDARRVVEPPSA